MGIGNGLGAFAQGFNQGYSQSDAMFKSMREKQIKREIARVMAQKTGDPNAEAYLNAEDPEALAMQGAGDAVVDASRSRRAGLQKQMDDSITVYNSPEQQMSRVADVYGKYGDVDRMLGLRKDVQGLAYQRQQMDLAKSADTRAAEGLKIQQQAAQQAADTFKHNQGIWDRDSRLDAAMARTATDASSDNASYEAGMRDLSKMTPDEIKMLKAGKADTSWVEGIAGLKRGQGDVLREKARVLSTVGGHTYEKDASALRKEAEGYDAEGMKDALARVHADDLTGANILWNSRGEFTGQLFTRKYTDPKTKKQMVEGVNLRTGKIESVPLDELELTAKERMAQALKERELAMLEKYRQGMVANAGAKASDYTLVGSVDGKPVFRQPGSMDFWMKDDRGNNVKYTGPMDKIKGLAADKPYTKDDEIRATAYYKAIEGVTDPVQLRSIRDAYYPGEVVLKPLGPKQEARSASGVGAATEVSPLQDRELRAELASIKQQLSRLGDSGPTSYQLKKRASEINALLGR